MTQSERTRRFAYIDALRAIAALSVLVYHLAVHISGAQETPAWLSEGLRANVLNWIDLGRFGVVLFFFISGFVIPFSIDGGGMRKFWTSRLCRLYPPFWLGILAVVAVESILHGTQYSLRQISLNLTMVPQFFAAQPVSGIYWTLFVEMVFYVMCSMLFVTRMLESTRYIAVLVLGLAALSAVPIAANGFFQISCPVQYTSFHLSFLFAGTLIRKCLFEADRKDERLMYVVIFLLLAMVPLVAGSFFPISNGNGFVQFGSTSIITAYVLASVVFVISARFGKPVGSVLLRIGKSSYSLYLFHWPACAIVIAALPEGRFWSIPLLVVLGICFSIVIAEISYLLVEAPSIKLGKRLGLHAVLSPT